MTEPNSIERQLKVETTLRNVESSPNWEARERYKRLENLKHCIENDLPAPPDNSVCPAESKPQMLAVIEGLMKMCEQNFI